MKSTPSQPLTRLVAAVCLSLLGSCSLFHSRSPDSIHNVSRITAIEHLDLAEAEMARDDRADALDRLIAIRELRGLKPEVRNRCEALLERCADSLMETYRGTEFDSRDFERLYQLDLSSRLKARAGVLAALYKLEEGDRRGAAKMIKKIERKLPSHAERALAGEVVGRAGLELVEQGGRYFLIFRYRSRGVEALEFLVLTYPFDPRCAEAYHVLAETYEERRDLNLAVERAEDLIIYHPNTPLAIEAQVRLPRLRLKRLRRDDLDREEMVLAHQEILSWLERYEGHELTARARAIEHECARRLATSDLKLARYYDRIGNASGTRLHAERALEYASAADATSEAAAARKLLEALAPAGSADAAEEPPVGSGE